MASAKEDESFRLFSIEEGTAGISGGVLRMDLHLEALESGVKGLGLLLFHRFHVKKPGCPLGGAG